jgi:hypothetical protein
VNCAVRLDQRPVDVVADGGRTEQRLLAVLPVVDRLLALGRRQLALVDVALGASGRSIAERIALALSACSERSEKNTS